MTASCPSRYACFLIKFGQFEAQDKFCQSRVDPESRKSFALEQRTEQHTDQDPAQDLLHPDGDLVQGSELSGLVCKVQLVKKNFSFNQNLFDLLVYHRYPENY
jgi:hypothetical protein